MKITCWQIQRCHIHMSPVSLVCVEGGSLILSCCLHEHAQRACMPGTRMSIPCLQSGIHRGLVGSSGLSVATVLTAIL